MKLPEMKSARYHLAPYWLWFKKPEKWQVWGGGINLVSVAKFLHLS